MRKRDYLVTVPGLPRSGIIETPILARNDFGHRKPTSVYKAARGGAAVGLFGTNGIRGVFPSELGMPEVHDICCALAEHLGRCRVLVGRDGRASSEAVAETACSVLNSRGIDCAQAGLVPTPCLEYAVKKLGYAAGVMATASHNPPQYAGIKVCAGDGVELSRKDESDIERIHDARSWGWLEGSFGETVCEERALDAYVKGAASLIDRATIASRRPKVVLDIGNGAQAEAAPRFCSLLGVEPEVINGDIDPLFPGRGPEPTPETLGGLSEAVVSRGADLGVAFDGDGDRSMFCDERGNILTGDRSALLLARHVLAGRPGESLVTCINSGSSTELVADESGARVTRTRVGSVEVSRAMVESGALVGFEENGGFMYGDHNPVRDGVMTLGLMLEAMASSKMTVSELARSLPPSHTAKTKIPCTRERASGVLADLGAAHPDADLSDGVKITLGPREWVMVRPSGTEPILRIYAEAPSSARLGELLTEYSNLVRSVNE